MGYTVKELSNLSGVTIRALHYYEEIELLKPAYYGSNGYRFYEEKELLTLQQILFYKELGFTLQNIKKILHKSDFDKKGALHSHRRAISREAERLKQLLVTIDDTIQYLNGENQMKKEALYLGFISKEKQASYEEYLENRFGKDNPAFQESRQNVEKLSENDHVQYRQKIDENMQKIASFVKQGKKADSEEVQKAIQEHYNQIKTFWTPNRKTFTELGKLYTEFEWRSFFEKYDPEHPKLATYLQEAMRLFAEKNLL